MGLREILGIGGKQADWVHVGNWLRDNYVESATEKVRQAQAAKRDELFEGKGDQYVDKLIETAFKDQFNREQREALVEWAKWNNVIRRVAVETATVYSEPAKRLVANDNGTYQDFLERVNMDAVMRELDQKLVYHEDVWVQYRVRGEGDAAEPVIDIVTPARFWAVADPGDSTHLIAIIQRIGSTRLRETDAHFIVQTADEVFRMDAKCRVIQTSLETPTLGRLSGVLATTRPPSTKQQLLADEPCADLTAAHLTVWFQNVSLLKESKSATRQNYIQGDTSRATMGQTSDTERDVFLPEGVSVSSVDRGMDLSIFRENADHILERAAANHGLPPSVLHHRDSSSGAEVNLRRLPIRENRKKRIPFLRRVERELAEIMSAVNAIKLPRFAFNTDGWSMDFGEVEQPLTDAEQDAVFEKRRQLGLTNTLEEIKRRNPDVSTDERALEVLEANIAAETLRIEAMKEWMVASGALGAAQPANENAGQDMQPSNDNTPRDEQAQDSTVPPQFRRRS